jgi:hypothetical protein
MDNINNYNDFLNETYKNTVEDYMVGDIVLIRYWLTGDISPVKILTKKTHSYYIVSHKVDNSFLYNAPDHGVNVKQIIGRYKKDMDDEIIKNPKLKPDLIGISPGSDSDSISNDIAF